MAIKDLQARQGNVDIVVDIVDVGEIREFEKFGNKGRVASAIAKDESGDIKLSLWNEQIDQVKAGDKVHITNGYVSEWQGEKQLTTGKMGKLEVVGEGSKENSESKEEASKNTEEKKKEEKLDGEPVTEEEEIE
ncbi:hypothetical protein ISS05_00760 [Candidatus Woesearchaeota archaeon]|nr:hypothetical protein [Candidatus Woesearchaeota archaeon]